MISRALCEEVLAAAASTGADYAELFAEKTFNRSVSMLDSRVQQSNDNVVAGVGIRVFKGLRSVAASTVDTSREGLLRCAGQAAAALGEGTAQISIVLRERLYGDIHPVRLVPGSFRPAEKADILKKAYFAAKNADPAIVQVQGNLLDVDHNILVANSEGVYANDRQMRVRLSINAVADKGEGTQTGSASPGARKGLEFFSEDVDPEAVGREAARQALVMAGAGYCPAGLMPVVIDNAFGGVIFHEACGHSLEASSVAYGTSQFAGKLGQQIANEKVTAVDDGTIPNAWGSINFDDEGTPSHRNVLIENGILKSYMIDKFGGRRMGMAPTGNARRESYAYVTTSRMTNTFICAGSDSNDDISSSVDFGLYAKAMGGGSVNPATGQFNFSVREGYLIRNGKVAEPVRGASLVGTGSEILMKIDMVGKELERAQGMCGASSGSIPTDVGQPMIRVSSITVGGR